MAHDLLLEATTINGMPMRNRFITGPMERRMANRDGSLSQTYIDYLVERARGGASLIVVESTYVDQRGMGEPLQVGCHGDHVIPQLMATAEMVHEEGAKLALELYFGGRVVSPRASQRQPIAPSSIPCELLDPCPVPREMTRSDIADIVTKFAEAARRCVVAGVDMIHLHGAHGYLLCAFLSSRTNHRTDEYGGSLENRARFPLEVLQAVREVVGPTYPIGYRLSAEEYVEGGLELDETVGFSRLLAMEGIDLIDVSGGSYESVAMIAQSAYVPRGGFLENALSIKRAVGSVPVSVAQRMNDPNFASNALDRGLDFITLSRAFHADPSYAGKLAGDLEDEIIPCIACLSCSDMLAEGKTVGCTTNTASGMERRRRLPIRTVHRRITVVGGGLAGLQAATLLGRHGHLVTLYERNATLGGQLRHSSLFARDFGAIVEYLTRQLDSLEVETRLRDDIDSERILGDEPDAVVLATGAIGGLTGSSLAGHRQRFDLFSALERDSERWKGEEVVIVGGDAESCRLAVHIDACGGTVHIVEPRREVAHGRGPASRLPLVAALNTSRRLQLHTESTVEEAGATWVVIQTGGLHRHVEGVDSLVIGGRTADNHLHGQLLSLSPDLEIYVVGDASAPRDMYSASHDAADAAEQIHLRAVAA